MTFHLRMAWRSLRNSRGLTAVMIVALALGIATWYVQRQIFDFLATKTPFAKDGVYLVALERGDPAVAARPSRIETLLPSILLAPHDADAMLASAAATRATLTFGAPGLLEPEGRPAETVRVRYATRDLFELFAIPFADGQPWSADADVGGLAGARIGPAVDVAVIDERVARRLFPGQRAVGRRLRVDGGDVTIVGVVASSHAERFHLYERFVTNLDAVYLPLAHAAASRAVADFQHAVAGAESGSAGVWVELPNPAVWLAFVARAHAHLVRERSAGRAAAPRALTLRPAREWVAAFAPGGTINLWPLLSVLCLVTCALNLVRMLIAKFSGRSSDLGLLRAMGAHRSAILAQLMLEAALIGLIAGALGVGVGMAMMPLVANTTQGVPGNAPILEAGTALVSIAAATGAAIVAALYPAWRLARGTPAAQMRRA